MMQVDTSDHAGDITSRASGSEAHDAARGHARMEQGLEALMRAMDDSKEVSDGEPFKPRGRERPRKGLPVQAAATSEEPTRLNKGTPGGAHSSRTDQDTRQLSEQDTATGKRRSQGDEDSGYGEQDTDREEQLPAKRKRTQLFSIKDIIAAEKGDANGLPPAGPASQQAAAPSSGVKPSQRQQQQPVRHRGVMPDDQEWVPPGQQHQQNQHYHRHQQQQQRAVDALSNGGMYSYSATGQGIVQAANGSDVLLHARSSSSNPEAADTAGAAAADNEMHGSDPAATAVAADAAVGASWQDFNPDLLPKGVQRDMALQRERCLLAEAAQAELGPDSLGPDTNIATLVQRILKCGVLTRKAVEYRKRAKGLGPADYNRGTITSAGLIRCGCHGSDITMSEFEQHSNSQIHRPAEYIFIKSVDMSLKSFAMLVLTKPIDSNLWYCLTCNDGGDLLCCEGCPAAYHTTCLGAQMLPVPNSEWLCGECIMAGKQPRWSSRGPLRRFTPLAGAASAAGSTSNMRRGSNTTGGGSNRGGGRNSSADGVPGKGSKAAARDSDRGGYGASAYGAAAYGNSSGNAQMGGGLNTAYNNELYSTEEPHMGSAMCAGNLAIGNYSSQGGWGRGSGLNMAAAGTEPYCSGVAGLEGRFGSSNGFENGVAAGFNVSQMQAMDPGSQGYGAYGAGSVGLPPLPHSQRGFDANMTHGVPAVSGYMSRPTSGTSSAAGAAAAAAAAAVHQQPHSSGGNAFDVLMSTLQGMSGQGTEALLQQLQQLQQEQQQQQTSAVPGLGAAEGQAGYGSNAGAAAVGADNLPLDSSNLPSQLLSRTPSHQQEQQDYQQQQQHWQQQQQQGMMLDRTHSQLSTGMPGAGMHFGSAYTATDANVQDQQRTATTRPKEFGCYAGSGNQQGVAGSVAKGSKGEANQFSSYSQQRGANLQALAAAAAAAERMHDAQQQQHTAGAEVWQQHNQVKADPVHGLSIQAAAAINKQLAEFSTVGQYSGPDMAALPKAATAAAVGGTVSSQQQQQQWQAEQQQVNGMAAVQQGLNGVAAGAAGPSESKQAPIAARRAAAGQNAGSGGASAAAVSQAPSPAEAAAAAADDTATTASGGATATAAADAAKAAQQQGLTSPTGTGMISKDMAALEAAAVSTPGGQQQQGSADAAAAAEERRAAVAAALRAGSTLVSAVLGANSLSEAQRAVAAGGSQLLAALGDLL